MQNAFNIRFQLQNNDLPKTVDMEAKVQIHHSLPYFIVRDFRYSGPGVKYRISAVPEQEIKCIETATGKKWVHKHSSKETPLSMAIGLGIEKVFEKQHLSPPCY